jgi:hypothetical protein
MVFYFSLSFKVASFNHGSNNNHSLPSNKFKHFNIALKQRTPVKLENIGVIFYGQPFLEYNFWSKYINCIFKKS